jgi:hypothetical protein
LKSANLSGTGDQYADFSGISRICPRKANQSQLRVRLAAREGRQRPYDDVIVDDPLRYSTTIVRHSACLPCETASRSAPFIMRCSTRISSRFDLITGSKFAVSTPNRA